MADSLTSSNKIIEGITGTSQEGATGTSKEAQNEKKMVTIDLEKNIVLEPEREREHSEEKHTEELDQGIEYHFVDLENVDSPFILKR